MASFKRRSKVGVICKAGVPQPAPIQHSQRNSWVHISSTPQPDLPCTHRASGTKASNSFSALLDLILVGDFKYINNDLQYQGQVLHLFTSIQVIYTQIHHVLNKTACPIQLLTDSTTMAKKSLQLLLVGIHSWIQKSEEQKKKENNTSIRKTKHFLEEFTKKIILRKPIVTETQTLTY